MNENDIGTLVVRAAVNIASVRRRFYSFFPANVGALSVLVSSFK
jgi:hypothetical protein